MPICQRQRARGRRDRLCAGTLRAAFPGFQVEAALVRPLRMCRWDRQGRSAGAYACGAPSGQITHDVTSPGAKLDVNADDACGIRLTRSHFAFPYGL